MSVHKGTHCDIGRTVANADRGILASSVGTVGTAGTGSNPGAGGCEDGRPAQRARGVPDSVAFQPGTRGQTTPEWRHAEGPPGRGTAAVAESRKTHSCSTPVASKSSTTAETAASARIERFLCPGMVCDNHASIRDRLDHPIRRGCRRCGRAATTLDSYSGTLPFRRSHSRGAARPRSSVRC